MPRRTGQRRSRSPAATAIFDAETGVAAV